MISVITPLKKLGFLFAVYISDYLWPCGVYAGLTEGARSLERECRASRKTR